jgi:hypothetical protein
MSELLKPDFASEPEHVRFKLYNRFLITMPIKDWVFMCKNRWFSDEPEIADVEAEFGVCGARQAKSDEEANEIVRNTVKTYRRIMHADIETECRKFLDSTVRTVARIDENGKIFFEDVLD